MRSSHRFDVEYERPDGIRKWEQAGRRKVARRCGADYGIEAPAYEAEPAMRVVQPIAVLPMVKSFFYIRECDTIALPQPNDIFLYDHFEDNEP